MHLEQHLLQQELLKALLNESDHPEITKRIIDKSICFWYNFGLITQTENRIHFFILKEYQKKWLNKRILEDLTKLCIKILKEHRKVSAICSPKERAVIRLAKLFGFSFLRTGEYKEKEYVIYELRGINYDW